jgi:AcrR family transcriptional regulator
LVSSRRGKTAAAAKPKRSRATQQRAIDTRRKIVEAAIDEFARNGYEGASTRAIAAAAGLQHTLVTYHFEGKEGLWREAIASILTTYAANFTARLEGLRGVDDVTTLRLLHEDFIRFAATNLNFHRLMAHVASAPSRQLDWLVEAYLRNTFDSRAELIRSAQKAGRYVEGDPYHLEYIFIGAVTRIFMLGAEVEKIMRRSPYDPAFVDEHVRVCLGLFFRDPPAVGAAARKQAAAPPVIKSHNR